MLRAIKMNTKISLFISLGVFTGALLLSFIFLMERNTPHNKAVHAPIGAAHPTSTTQPSLTTLAAPTVDVPTSHVAVPQNSPAALSSEPEIISSTPANTNKDAVVDTNEVLATLQNLSGLLEESSGSHATDSDANALKVNANNAEVVVAKDATTGVVVNNAKDEQTVSISLPNAKSAQPGEIIAPNTVAYTGDNGSANAVQTIDNGDVRMLTLIDNSSAPTDYSYIIDIPNGGHVEIASNGGAVVLDSEGLVLATIASPWAKDALGKEIKTHFTTDGQTLTQHVDHRISDVTYPVTADPYLNWTWSGVYLTYSKYELAVARVTSGAAIAAARMSPLGIFAGTALYGVFQESTGGKCLTLYKSYWNWNVSAYLYYC